MAETPSEVQNLLPCLFCGRTLYPTLVGSMVTFHCRSGHQIALDELLKAQSDGLKCGLEILLAKWNRQHHALIHTVEEARKNGHLDVAEIFHRHAQSLESRISRVRDAFSQSDSSRMIKAASARAGSP